MKDILFPKIERSVENYLTEEEGNISRSKLLMIGSMVLLMGLLYVQDAFAAHSSHSSHESHSSHSSGDVGVPSSHESHTSHSSHSSGSEGYTAPSHSSSSHSSGSSVHAAPSNPSSAHSSNGNASPSHSSSSVGATSSQSNPVSSTPEAMPTVPTPHIPPQNNFATGTTPPQQSSLSIPDTPILSAAMILPGETKNTNI